MSDPYHVPRQNDSYGTPPPQQPGLFPEGQAYRQPEPYGQPGYSGPPGYAYGRQPYGEETGTNGFAIASLIFGILGGLLGIVFAMVALNQIDKRGGLGRGMAVAGLSLGVLWLFGAAVAVAATNDDQRDDTGDITEDSEVSAFDLEVGDCLTDIPDDEIISSLTAVPCSAAHEGEVYHVFEISDREYPGDEAVFSQAEGGCFDALEEATSRSGEYGLFYLHPQEPTWSFDREVVCIAITSGETTGSLTDD